MSQFKSADPSLGRIGERAFLVSKQFTFYQALRKRGAVDTDKGILRTLTSVMDQLSKQLFPGATFSCQQD
jgi:hypothetical protein